MIKTVRLSFCNALVNLVIGVSAIASAATITGTVTDSAGEPVAGIRVILVESNRTALTAEDGSFAFDECHANCEDGVHGEQQTRDMEGLRARVAQADTFVHAQDLPETDLLLAEDYASHEAGFAAAQKITGGAARLYHLDNTDPSRPRARTLTRSARVSSVAK